LHIKPADLCYKYIYKNVHSLTSDIPGIEVLDPGSGEGFFGSARFCRRSGDLGAVVWSFRFLGQTIHINNKKNFMISGIHMRTMNAVQSILAGMYTKADEQILMAKIYNIWYFIVHQPGAGQ
jgi:hypothetical protein